MGSTEGVRAWNAERSPLRPDSEVKAYKRDLEIDAECAEEQAENGPYYPERGITKESLLAYAKECREKMKNPRVELIKALKGKA